MIAFLSRQEIREAADEFLRRYNPALLVPVPIEEIIEFELHMTIQPFEGLCSRYSREGFLSNDLTTIYVDAGRMRDRINRYRYTLAHELGHWVLHRPYIQAHMPRTPLQWKQHMKCLTPKDESKLEFQANELAGCLLVPAAPLRQAWEEAKYLAKIKEIDLEELGDYGIGLLASWVAKRFEVSVETLMICLKRDDIVV